MRQQWYGDRHDLIKWGVLIHLALTRKLKQIVYVAYLRPDDPKPTIRLGRKPVSFPEHVWKHFRHIHDIRRLARTTGLQIRLIDTPFEAKKRVAYTEAVVTAIRQDPERPRLVFLDPDTGISKRNANAKHVKPAEVQKIWSALCESDCLVLYQHANRNKRWVEGKRQEVKRAINSSNVKTFRATRGSKGVALHFAIQRRQFQGRKNGRPQQRGLRYSSAKSRVLGTHWTS